MKISRDSSPFYGQSDCDIGVEGTVETFLRYIKLLDAEDAHHLLHNILRSRGTTTPLEFLSTVNSVVQKHAR